MNTLEKSPGDDFGEGDFNPGGGEGIGLSEQERRSLRILVVDDDPGTVESCQSVLEAQDFRVDVVRTGREALELLRSQDYQILLIDQNMPEVDGLDVLAAKREHCPETLAIMITGYATTGASIEALKAGAWDYLPKPFTATQLLVLIGRAAHRVLRLRATASEYSSDGEDVVIGGSTPILGRSAAIKNAVSRALKVAKTDASVFITGESGTGKELIARCIHQASCRSRNPFVVVNCAALPGELLESEIFGHRKGAFTGAVREKPGLIEEADRGTFFLDELCEMPLGLQPKLLRVLQDGVVRRVGSEREEVAVDVRLISATNRDPGRALEDGVLREDLFYRLRVVPIHLPPLRRRREDIPVLVRHFVEHFWYEHGLPGEGPPPVSEEAMTFFKGQAWPGNVRQLKNLVEQLVVLSDPGSSIDDETVSAVQNGDGVMGMGIRRDPIAAVDLTREYHDAKQDLIDHFEREYLIDVVARCNGNISEAARNAGIDRTTLYRLMEKHDFTKQELRSGLTHRNASGWQPRRAQARTAASGHGGRAG